MEKIKIYNIDFNNDDFISEMKELINFLNQCSYNYYVLKNPIISDNEYDELSSRLKFLEKQNDFILPDSPNRRIFSSPDIQIKIIDNDFFPPYRKKPTQKYEREYKGQSLLSNINNYIVIDLETTGLDPSHDEIIEIAALKILDGVVVDKFETLIKPESKIPKFITQLTGITNEMVNDAPSIKNALPVLLKFIGNFIIIGHNVNFDINFLYDNLLNYNQLYLSNDFIDTMRLSRKIFKDFENHRLITLISKFNINIISSHRALKDCIATQLCYEYIKNYINENNINLANLRNQYYQKSLKNISTTPRDFDETHPLYNKLCVFTGALNNLTRVSAAKMVLDAGGKVGDSLTTKTNFLIVGCFDYINTVEVNKSSKLLKAEYYKLKGYDIEIISENVFIDLLNNKCV